jgi:hypothetical protein
VGTKRLTQREFNVGDIVYTKHDSEGPLSQSRKANILAIERWNVLLEGEGFCCWVRKRYIMHQEVV